MRPLLVPLAVVLGVIAPPPLRSPARQPAGPAEASYVAMTVNGGPLPSRDRVKDAGGSQYLVEFDELVLAIRPGMEFRAALRYRQALATKNEVMGRQPIQSTTVYGRYEARGNRVRFIPDPKRGGKGIQILDGTFAPGRIDVPFVYRNGAVTRTAQVVLKRDNSRF